MYLYKVNIHKIPSEVVGLSSIEITQHQTNKTDFETNFKAQTISVSEVVIAETTFVIDKSYTEFKAMVVTPVTWADVKYTEDNQKYKLFLLRDSLL